MTIALERTAQKICLEIMRDMYLSRFTDEKMAKIVRQNKGATFQLSAAGHELTGITCAKALIPGKDWGLPYYRDQPFAIGLGCCLEEIFGAFLAREVPNHSGGRMMPGHFSHKELNIPCQSSVVGSQFLHAVGVALGIKLSKGDEVVYVSAGEGATSQGDFHEALNFSSINRLPVIFVIQDNGWAISVNVREQTAGGCISKIAKGYEGLAVFTVDGCSYPELEAAMSEAVQRGRKKHGPSLIIAKVPRLAAHSSSDDPLKYKDASQTEVDKKRDPLPIFEKWLLEQDYATREDIERIRAEAFLKVEKAAVDAEKFPHPSVELVMKNVFCEEPNTQLRSAAAPTTGEKIVIMDALNHALDEEMQKDPGVVVFGQDVALGKGGVFGITKHLSAKHGSERCFNTPLAESTIVGIALGMSLNGIHKPVAEIQFADYIWTGVNQLFNELASFHYRSNGQWNCPLVLRMPCGGYIQGGPYHSQSIEGFLSHCPGLKIAIPSNAADAKGLLKAAIRDPNPVVFFEHKALYRQQKYCARPEPDDDYVVPFGKAAIVREGTDLTVVCWGMMVLMAVDVAEKLHSEGISVEIIDLRTIVPFDMPAIVKSLQKSGKLLIAHEAPKNCGFGAEIAARAVEEAFHYLDAPIERVCGLDCAVPYNKDLESKVLPQLADLEKAIRKLAAY